MFILPLKICRTVNDQHTSSAKAGRLSKGRCCRQRWWISLCYTISVRLVRVRMHGYELVMAVSALAQNKVARKDMADNGVFEHLVKYGAADTDTYHQELTLTAIHALLGHDTVPIALRGAWTAASC
jgi:hypothetical protein